MQAATKQHEPALAVLLEVLAQRGEFEAAEAADQIYRLAEPFPTMPHGAWLLAAVVGVAWPSFGRPQYWTISSPPDAPRLG